MLPLLFGHKYATNPKARNFQQFPLFPPSFGNRKLRRAFRAKTRTMVGFN